MSLNKGIEILVNNKIKCNLYLNLETGNKHRTKNLISIGLIGKFESDFSFLYKRDAIFSECFKNNILSKFLNDK